MNPNNPRSAVIEAERRLVLARMQQLEQTRRLRGMLQRHRASLLVGAGITAGVLLGALPLRRWLRTGASLFGAGLTLARTPLGPLALGALFGKHVAKSDDERPPPA